MSSNKKNNLHTPGVTEIPKEFIFHKKLTVTEKDMKKIMDAMEAEPTSGLRELFDRKKLK